MLYMLANISRRLYFLVLFEGCSSFIRYWVWKWHYLHMSTKREAVCFITPVRAWVQGRLQQLCGPSLTPAVLTDPINSAQTKVNLHYNGKHFILVTAIAFSFAKLNFLGIFKSWNHKFRGNLKKCGLLIEKVSLVGASLAYSSAAQVYSNMSKIVCQWNHTHLWGFYFGYNLMFLFF